MKEVGLLKKIENLTFSWVGRFDKRLIVGFSDSVGTGRIMLREPESPEEEATINRIIEGNVTAPARKQDGEEVQRGEIIAPSKPKTNQGDLFG